jgi:predicted nucleotide-binding protein
VARRILERHPGVKVILLTSDIGGSSAEAWAAQKSVPYIRKGEGPSLLFRTLDRFGITGKKKSPVSLIVHGHDEIALLQLKNYIQNTLKWSEPVVLRERTNGGRTVIEKFEDLGSDVDCVFVLLTPDDAQLRVDTDDQRRRSRQNVIFELGFFYGAFGRTSGRIFLLHRGPVELPSDIAGVVWIDISGGIASAGEEIRREVEALFENRGQSR